MVTERQNMKISKKQDARVRVADYIADQLALHGIRHIFTVTGGGAMHLNDALGHHPALTCIYQHQEQACAMAAESYARVHNRMAAVCVTTGPGGTNALTGVLGAWLDSIPLLVLSGQVRYDTTVRSTGLGLRAFGDQEYDIVRTVCSMTKYAVMVEKPEQIRRCLEKAVFLATSGRPGPCWLDLPLDVQGALVLPDSLESYDPSQDSRQLPPKVTDQTARAIIHKIQTARRPVLNAGNGIRIAGAAELLLSVAEKLGIPVVTGWNSIDLIADTHPLYAGRAGIMGDRAGNWAVQNSDVFLSIGSRLSVRQVGYSWDTWARNAYTIVEDIDPEELKKPSIHVDLPVWADAYDLLAALDRNLKHTARRQQSAWMHQCLEWRRQYPVVQEKHFRQQEPVNVYALIKKLSEALPEDSIIVAANGSASVVSSQAFVIRPGQRFILNSGAASMGYGLPASIGACIAADRAPVVCITGDGSIQMNLQELQTIIHHRLPIRIFVINNDGYHSIRQTQQNYFQGPLTGVGTDSGDLSFPSMERLAGAYGYPYVCIRNSAGLERIGEILEKDAPWICEVFVDTRQRFEPKAASERLTDGKMVSLPLEDLAPRLPKEELDAIMQTCKAGRGKAGQETCKAGRDKEDKNKKAWQEKVQTDMEI